MKAFLKKSSDGQSYAAGPVLVHRDSGHPYLSLDEPIVDAEITEQVAEAIFRHQHKLTDTKDIQQDLKVIALLDKDLQAATRIFVGKVEKTAEGEEVMIVTKTLNLDKKQNPSQSVEALDEAIRIELSPGGGITQKDVDQLQQLSKSGKLVQAAPDKAMSQALAQAANPTYTPSSLPAEGITAAVTPTVRKSASATIVY